MNMASVLRPTPMTICLVLESRTTRVALSRVSSRPESGFFKRKRMKNSVERSMKTTMAANWKAIPPMDSVSNGLWGEGEGNDTYQGQCVLPSQHRRRC